MALGLLLSVLWVLTTATPAAAAEGYSADAVKAAFLYRFGSYVEWPDEALAAPNFTIAVIGAPGVVTELQGLLLNHQIKNRPAQVRQITDIKNIATDIGNAQMLYIGEGQADDTRAVVAALATRPIMIVTDNERGLEVGSTVNFLLMDRRVRFEISLVAAERSGLKISSDMLSVATRVRGGRLHSDVSCIPRYWWDVDQACATRVAATRRSVAPSRKNKLDFALLSASVVKAHATSIDELAHGFGGAS